MSVRSIETSRFVESSPMVSSVSAETDDVALCIMGKRQESSVRTSCSMPIRIQGHDAICERCGE